MAVYDQWHRSPRPGDVPCGCGTKRSPLYPSAQHKRGRRWQVRYRNLSGKQKSRGFATKVGQDPARHADAFDAQVQRELDTGNYTDPALAEATLQSYAETWRKAQPHKPERASTVEGYFRCHVYEGEPDSGRTPMGGVAIGQHPLGLLARRPSLTQSWITAMPLAGSTARSIIGLLSSVFQAAMEDGIIGRDPTAARSVTRPPKSRKRPRVWTAAQVAAVRDALPGRYQVIPELGAATGMRQGEVFGLGADDVQFLGRRPHVRVERQLKVIGGQPMLAPVKNRKPHSVPLAPSAALALARHMEAFPPVTVTLPWYDPGDRMHGQPVTVRLVLVNARRHPIRSSTFGDAVWHPALERAGIVASRRGPAREDGMHVLRHTFASLQLRARVDVVRVAAWMGDTPEMVLGTYAHLLPGDDDSDGRDAVDGFLSGASCAPDVQPEGGEGTSSQASGLGVLFPAELHPLIHRRRLEARVFGSCILSCRTCVSRRFTAFHGVSESCAARVPPGRRPVT